MSNKTYFTKRTYVVLVHLFFFFLLITEKVSGYRNTYLFKSEWFMKYEWKD